MVVVVVVVVLLLAPGRRPRESRFPTGFVVVVVHVTLENLHMGFLCLDNVSCRLAKWPFLRNTVHAQCITGYFNHASSDQAPPLDMRFRSKFLAFFFVIIVVLSICQIELPFTNLEEMSC